MTGVVVVVVVVHVEMICDLWFSLFMTAGEEMESGGRPTNGGGLKEELGVLKNVRISKPSLQSILVSA